MTNGRSVCYAAIMVTRAARFVPMETSEGIRWPLQGTLKVENQDPRYSGMGNEEGQPPLVPESPGSG